MNIVFLILQMNRPHLFQLPIMEKIAEFMYLTATQFETKADEIRAGVSEICAKYPLYE